MRTSDSRPNFIWSEVQRGRLRQRWGWTEDQDLRRIVVRQRAGVALSPDELSAWPARRMLGTEPDGIRFNDLIVTQNLPRQGRVSVCRVVGPYEYAVPDSPADYGHVLPVELVVEDVSRYDISDALRHAISLRPRLYEITPYGGDVEAMVAVRGAPRRRRAGTPGIQTIRCSCSRVSATVRTARLAATMATSCCPRVGQESDASCWASSTAVAC